MAVIGTTPEAAQESEFLTKFASTVHWITPTNPLSILGDVMTDFKNDHDNVQHWEDTTCMTSCVECDRYYVETKGYGGVSDVGCGESVYLWSWCKAYYGFYGELSDI